MRKAIKQRILLVVAALLLSLTWDASARSWDIARLETVPDAKVVVRQPDIEIRASRGVVYITTGKAVQVKIYSILGHLVAQSTLQNGNYRIALNNHGVYLIKIGDMTYKVAV